ncbi:hydroxymethylglutaryl-CoA reductase [Mollisia scopiformis]|uniref:hydroxymethylglutaryl-CoA reductase (NADPH) n=1 Tax=Mollisia scopiformis TaxID=149040 RepID=A0A132B930_MOLSC|nr:hydroxymethylglutaryl-CoA reductase [Mollisia scopiformis]KUJ08912.1 hydroxymethylglutaryl-CoA reductase [Mollisia scopiformis]
MALDEFDTTPRQDTPALSRHKKSFVAVANLKHISRDLTTSQGIKIENHVGFTQVPVGLAGPLTINGTYQKCKEVYGPLATVEPTLVAACSRGCKLFSTCGGISTSALTEGLSRVPVFVFSTISAAVAFYHRVPDLLGEFKVSAEKTSRHAVLLSLTPHIIGTGVHVKFMYSCGDAAGQNMVTLGTHATCTDFLSSESRPVELIDFQLEGNISSDKKLSWGSVHEPRGVSVMAWSTITNDASLKIMGSSTKRLKTVLTRIEEGGLRNGNLGQCLNTANVVTAMFIACGQDAASVLESGWSQLTAEVDDETGDLTLSLFFPSLLVGTVGGGTGYATQKEALDLIGCSGEGKKWAFAETVAAFALALEASTLAALANDTFAASHKTLARDGKLSKL